MGTSVNPLEKLPKKRRGGKKRRKLGRNKVKCANYRARVGKPRGPGVPGNKRGKNSK